MAAIYLSKYYRKQNSINSISMVDETDVLASGTPELIFQGKYYNR
jgi:hypothetical protein